MTATASHRVVQVQEHDALSVECEQQIDQDFAEDDAPLFASDAERWEQGSAHAVDFACVAVYLVVQSSAQEPGLLLQNRELKAASIVDVKER